MDAMSRGMELQALDGLLAFELFVLYFLIGDESHTSIYRSPGSSWSKKADKAILLAAMPFRTLIFDFDGVIADTRDLIIEIGNAYAAETGREPLSDEDINIYYEQGAHALMVKRGFSLLDVARLLHRGSELFAKQAGSVKLVPGVGEAIKNAIGSGIRVAVVTSNTEESVKKAMGDFSKGLAGIFPEKDLFGKAAKLKKVIKGFGADPADVLYVGDEPRDMVAARKAGAHPIGAAWGFGSKRSLISAGAEKVLMLPEEIAEL